MKITSARKPSAAKSTAKPSKAKKAKTKTAAPAKPRAGAYIAPRRPVSSGGEGGGVSTYSPPDRVYVPVSSGGEGGGGGGYYVPVTSSVSYGGE